MKQIEKIEEFFEEVEIEDVLSYLGEDAVMTYAVDTYRISNILDYLDHDEIADYLSDYRFIASGEDDAVEILKDSGYMDKDFEIGLDSNKMLPDFMQNACVELIQNIIDKEGFNYLYSLLEPEKDKLHIL